MDYIDEALAKIRANSGQNVYNMAVQRGSLGIGRNRERAIQVAEDTLSADPNLLQQTILKIAGQSGQQSQDLSLGATEAGVRADQSNANALIGIERYKEQVRAAKQARTDALWSAVGGGLLSLTGGIAGAVIGAKGTVDAMKEYNKGVHVTPPDPSALQPPILNLPNTAPDAGVPPMIRSPQSDVNMPQNEFMPWYLRKGDNNPYWEYQ